MTKYFFTSVVEALAGFLPREIGAIHHQVGPHNLKVWTRSPHEHYEVQRLGKAVLRSAGLKAETAIEVGFHAEHPDVAHNDALIARLTEKEKVWRRGLGREPAVGSFLGPKAMAERWRRISEVWTEIQPEEEGAIIEAAERLGAYMRTIEPIIERAPDSKCECWKA